MKPPDDHLRTYLLAFGPALNIAGLEVRLELPRRTLRHWLRDGRALPVHHRDKVERWAKFFGYAESRQYDSII